MIAFASAKKNSKKFNPYPMSDNAIRWPGYCLKIANSTVYLECNICCDYQFFSSIQNLKLWMVTKSMSDKKIQVLGRKICVVL
jgi:hypothetical protein